MTYGSDTLPVQHETEPNDADDKASSLSLSVTGLAGTFKGSNKRDDDFFQIESDKDQIADLYIETETEVDFDVTLYDSHGKEQAKYRANKEFALKRLFINSGKNTLKLSAYLKEEAPYKIYVYHPRLLEEDAESEPNDTLQSADIFDEGQIFKGLLGEKDTDLVALKTTSPLSLWRLDVNGTDIMSVKYLNAAGDPLIHARVTTNGLPHIGLQSLLFSPGTHFFEIKGSGHYRVSARQTGGAPPEVLSRNTLIEPDKIYPEIEPNDQPGLSMTLSEGQTREGVISFDGDRDYYRFSLSNPAEIELNIRSDDSNSLIASLMWGLHQTTNITQQNIKDDKRPQILTFKEKLEAGDYLLNIRALGMMEEPYILTYKVISKEASSESSIPKSLLGQLSAQKAGWTLTAATAKKLIDGSETQGSAALMEVKETYDIEIEGKQPLPLKGIIIDTRHGHAPGATLKSFRLEADTTNDTRVTLLEKTLPVKEATYGFDIPQGASVTKLYFTPLSAGFEKNSSVYLGELTLIPILTDQENTALTLDLLTPENGGQVLYAPPFLPAFNMLEADDRSIYVNVPSKYNGELFWVAGFHRARTADITKLEWTEPSKAKPDDLIAIAHVFGSTGSPDGPWQNLGVFQRAENGRMKDLTFTNPISLRYLKYVIERDEPTRRRWILPDKITAIEHTPNTTYHSILGEWGDQYPEKDNAISSIEDRNMLRHPGTASIFPLPLQTPVKGDVEKDKTINLYDITVPAGIKTLALTFTHPQMLSVKPALMTTENTPVTLNLAKDSYDAQNRHVRLYQAVVEPGSYKLEVSEAPLSLAVTWDTSGSVNPFRADIINAVRSVARYAAPEEVMINLFPFREPESKPLMRKWSGDPTKIYTSLQHYNWSDQASNVEGALIGAAKSLQEQPGSRAIILVTDGESSGGNQNMESWQAVNALKPRIYVTAIPGSSAGERALKVENYLRHYARSYNGNYAILSGQNTFERGFEKVIEDLSGPKSYILEASASDQLPQPGYLKFEDPQQTQKIDLEKDLLIILDISGSMLQREGSMRRIDIARNAIYDVMTTLPKELQVGLRTLGGKSEDSCDTALHLPVALLDKDQLKNVLDTIIPVNGAKTPIAAALLEAQHDFKQAESAPPKDKMILLITDGEETCDGDPLAAVTELQKNDFDITVNIVGFAVAEDAIKEQFKAFATAGKGQYFDAEKADQISKALVAALLPAFQVEDKSGQVVARSTMGAGSVELLPGTYNLTLHTDPPQHYYDVVITSGETITLNIDETE